MNRRTTLTLASAAVTLIAAVAFVQTANADATPVMPAYLSSGLAECKAQLTAATTSADRTWANECVRLAQRAVDAWVKANPTPTATATATVAPTTVPPTTPPVTTPPATTPPPTTVPPTTVPPTTPPAQTTNCLPRPSACGFPDATNTGVPANWVPIKTVNGDQSVTTAGATLDGWDIHGCLNITAPNVTIRNSRILGAGCQYAVHNFSTGLQVLHSTITCGGGNGNGISDNEFSAIADDISGCENGSNVSTVNGSAGNVLFQDTYIHDLVSANGAHTDGVQIGQGAAHLRFLHNTIYNPAGQTSAIIMWDEGDPQNSDVTIADNILAGGGYTLYCPRSDAPNDQVTGNHFVPGFYGPSNGCTAGHVTWSGNVLDATGAALGGA